MTCARRPERRSQPKGRPRVASATVACACRDSCVTRVSELRIRIRMCSCVCVTLVVSVISSFDLRLLYRHSKSHMTRRRSFFRATSGVHPPPRRRPLSRVPAQRARGRNAAPRSIAVALCDLEFRYRKRRPDELVREIYTIHDAHVTSAERQSHCWHCTATDTS